MVESTSSPPVQIEEVAPRHVKALSRLFADIVANGDDSTFHPHPLTEEEAFKICRAQGLDRYFIAISAGEVLAYGLLRGWDEGFKEPSLGLAIHPRHQRKGLGRRMATYLIDAARHHGADSIRLTVYTDNLAAVSLYSQLGFTLTPVKDGKLLGRLNLSLSAPPSRLTVGICADGLIGWGGGMDLLVNMMRAMHLSEPGNRIILLAPGPSFTEPKFTWGSFRFAVKDTVNALLGRPRFKQNPEVAQAIAISELSCRIREHIPNLEVRYSAGLRDGLTSAADDLRLDAVFLAMRKPVPRPSCALVGYVPDYQHRHLHHLFSEKEFSVRNKIFGQLVGASDAMVMNANQVADDMRRFTHGPLPGMFVMPFAPMTQEEWLVERPELLTGYPISAPYFIICNQFWKHKDHLTAFRALGELLRKRPDVSLICTGATNDYRDPSYFDSLATEAQKLGLGERLRFLGHIPKRDQIELLKNAVALVQPTLFEGGPGGGSTYEAVALGKRVLLSDIPVNLEIDGGDVRFFKSGNHIELSRLMIEALDESPVLAHPSVLLVRSRARLRRNGEAIWSSIRSAIANRKCPLL